MQERYVLDNIINAEELLWIYNKLIQSSSWTLAHATLADNVLKMPFNIYPALHIESLGITYCEFFSGYFRSLTFRIISLLKLTHNAHIPSHIKRIHVGAKSSYTKTSFHVDSQSLNDWSILGFLNPVWNAPDGGQFYLKDERIEYKPGRFVVFPSSIEHDGGYVANETISYWRLCVNIVLTPAHDS
jgi:hypothetical protein